MKNEKDLLKVNGEVPVANGEENDESLEGYSYCDSHKQKCSNDCFGTPVVSPLN